MNNPVCCGKPAIVIQDEEWEGQKGVGIKCSVCQNAMFGLTEQEAIEGFMANAKEVVKKIVNNNNSQRGLVISPNSIRSVFEHKKTDLALSMNPILNSSTSAMSRLFSNNTEKYPAMVMVGKAWDKVFSTEEGKASAIHEIEESLLMCCELGKSGSIVPFGTTCKFIPEVDGIIFFLTNGNNAPFEDINIECIYEGDDPKSGYKEGNFFIDIKNGEEKEKVKSVAVWGTLTKSGKVVGEVYSAKRLLEKAELHSTPFKNYMKYKKAYEYQKSEGNIKHDPNGREFFTYYDVKDSSTDKYFDQAKAYFMQAESKGELLRDNKGEYALQKLPTFEKKIYRSYVEGGTEEVMVFIDELENPYAGADQPEMLRKTAGKSFLSKYAKVRNSEAAMNEVKTHKEAVEETLRMADSQFDVE